MTCPAGESAPRAGRSAPLPAARRRNQGFNRSLKSEHLYQREIGQAAELAEEVGEVLELFNCVRPHESLGWRQPLTMHRRSTPISGTRSPTSLTRDTSGLGREAHLGMRGRLSSGCVVGGVARFSETHEGAVVPVLTNDSVADVLPYRARGQWWSSRRPHTARQELEAITATATAVLRRSRPRRTSLESRAPWTRRVNGRRPR